MVCLSLLVLGTNISGAQEYGSQGFRIALFDGSHLDHWTASNCDIEIVDDRLKLVSGDGFVHSNAQYRDFVLELEWRPLKESEWDSGIYIRATLPENDRPWPRDFQINLKQGDAANLIGFRDARSEGLVRPGEWNRMKLTAVGDRISMEINGEKAWSVSGVEDRTGHIGLQSEVPLGGQFEFRNIVVTELDHRSLFDGNDLSHWAPAADSGLDCWDIQDNLLRCTGERGTWLRTVKTFGDFNLRLEYLLKAGGNSGVYVRVPDDGNHHGAGAGIEVQILDDRHERYSQLQDYQFSGSLYAVSAATARPSRAAGQWNQLEIDCNGHSYRVILNGVLIVDTDAEETPQLKERNTEGFLGLQNHNEEVFFRNLRVGVSDRKE